MPENNHQEHAMQTALSKTTPFNPTGGYAAVRRKLRAVSPWRWSPAWLVFVIGALVASVIIPAQATSRIIELFQELNTVIEPARRAATSLQGGLDREAAELEDYTLSGDTTSLHRYRSISAENDRQLALLAMLADQVGAHAAADVNALRGHVFSWRQLSHAERVSRFASIRATMTALQLRLADENQNRREQVQAAGRLSLVSNALLVLAAFAAIAGIIVHMLRERQLMSVLRERATREASLRNAAESLAGAFTLDDVAREIARTAVSVLPAHGAFVLHIEKTLNDTRNVVVRSTAGSEVPAIGTTCVLPGSLVEAAILSGGPMICRVRQADALMCNVVMIQPSISALVIPLHDGEAARGALVVLSATGFDSDDMIWARTYQHIATLAYEKVRLLDTANEGRRKLEQVMDSRSRLMRGFSHDVKNPLGAADGYTALILEGIYGKLTAKQQESMERVRRSINVALALIEDLNDFARAEAGKVKFNISLVDVAKLTHTLGAQYGASAHAKGLTLAVDIAPDLPAIETDAARLRQIVSNLLSNSIKYTDSGSVQLRVSESFDQSSVVKTGIRFDVTDTGPGIPAGQRALIFDEFSRLETTNHPGAGLGLPISKLLAEMLGGSISVDSEEGVGSTFSLWIPEQPLNYPEERHAVTAGRSDRDAETRSFTSIEGI